MLFGMSAVFAATGFYLLASARSRAERFSPLLMAASGLRRFWIPSRFYTVRGLSLQYRFAGALTLTMALFLLLRALVAFDLLDRNKSSKNAMQRTGLGVASFRLHLTRPVADLER
jgi:hypothetical protein